MPGRGDFMNCPKCGCSDSVVTDSRKHSAYTNRRRECCGCGFRFLTVEIAELNEMNFARIETIMKWNSKPRDYSKIVDLMYMKCFRFSQYRKMKGLKSNDDGSTTAE